jgi:hypothetical protein
MKKELEFPGCILVHTILGTTHLLDGPRDLMDLMDGDCLDDACMDEGRKTLPTDPGVYSATIEYWFQQGYFEGYPAPGESDYDFRLSNLRRIDLSRTPAPVEVERLVDDLLSVSKQLGQSEARGLYDHIEPAEVAINELKSRILVALSNTTPYLSQDVKGVYKYEIDSPDELDVGLHGFRDEVTVIVDSGEPGGDPTGEDSFEEYMRQTLIEWYDGAKVVFKKAGE